MKSTRGRKTVGSIGLNRVWDLGMLSGNSGPEMVVHNVRNGCTRESLHFKWKHKRNQMNISVVSESSGMFWAARGGLLEIDGASRHVDQVFRFNR